MEACKIERFIQYKFIRYKFAGYFTEVLSFSAENFFIVYKIPGDNAVNLMYYL